MATALRGPVFVQAVSASSNVAASITTAAITTTPGNLLHADLLVYATYTSFTDSKSNTWEVANAADTLVTNYLMQQQYAKNCLGGSSHTFTLTGGAGLYQTISVVEIAGADKTAPLDSAAQALDASGTSHTVTLAGPTGQPMTIACAAIHSATTATVYSLPDIIFTIRSNIAHSATAIGLMAATRTFYQLGTYSFVGVTSNSQATGTMLAMYKAASPTLSRRPVAGKPAGQAVYTRIAPWSFGTVGHWLMNETGSVNSTTARGRGAADVLRTSYLVPKGLPLNFEPGYATSPIGPCRTFDDAGDEFQGLVSELIGGRLQLTGAMSAMCVWMNPGQVVNNDPSVFGVAASGGDNTFGLFFDYDPDRLTWFNGASLRAFVSDHTFPVGRWYRLFMTRENAGLNGRMRLYVHDLTEGQLILDQATLGPENCEGTAATFSLGFSDWLAGGDQGVYQSVAEMRLWNVELNEAQIVAYDADPYYEFTEDGVMLAGAAPPVTAGAPPRGILTMLAG